MSMSSSSSVHANHDNDSRKNKNSDKSTAALSSILSSSNYFECLSLPVAIQPPSVIRRSFLKLSLLVHPDKNPNALAKEAFQTLSEAFEILYDGESQQSHLEEVLNEQEQQKRQQQPPPPPAARHEPSQTTNNEHENKREDSKATKKRKRTQHNWKEQRRRRREKTKQSASNSFSYKRWEDVVLEMKRREALEQAFVRNKSNQWLEKKVLRLVWKAMKVCRALDERAGCPPTFVNGLWAPLYEQEARKGSSLPFGFESRVVSRAVGTTVELIVVYRNIQTGEESETHPDPTIEGMIQKARKAEQTNKFRFKEEPRLFLGEIIEYLKEDHDYFDMDDDLLELEEEEKARNKPAATDTSSSYSKKPEYDY